MNAKRPIDDVAGKVSIQKTLFILTATKLAAVSTVIAGLVVLFVYWNATTRAILGTWFLSIVVLCVTQFVVTIRGRRALALTASPPVARCIAVWLIVPMLVASILWGAISSYLFLANDGYARALAILIPCALAAGAVPMYSSVYAGLVSMVSPMIAILATTLIVQATPVDAVIGLGILVFGGICLLTGRYMDDLLTKVFSLGFENEALLREARAARDETERAYERHRDVQEAARIQLEQRAREAEAGDHDKMRFIARASHDLRQPMSALQNFLEVARHWQEQGDVARVGGLLDKMNSSVTVLSRTFSQILDIAKYESGEYKPNVQPVDLRQLLRDIEDQFGILANAKGVEFRLRQLCAPPYFASSDYEMLWRVVSNLVANAIKYTPGDRKEHRAVVLVGATRIGSRFRINVYDTGVGIPAEHLATIWEPFFQIGKRERDRERGLGLGLSIVRAACESLGHEIDFRSVEERGSRFSIGLPVSVDQPSEPVLLEDEIVVDHAAHARVFLLEDDDDARQSQEALLSMWGARFVSGATVAAVLEHAAGDKIEPDVILTDFRLSEMETGADAITAIRTHYDRCIPAIVVTGDLARPSAALDGLRQVRLLHKPVKPARLRRTLNELLS